MELPTLTTQTRTVKLLSAKQLPKALRDHVRAHGFTNRAFRLVSFSDSERSVRATDTQWSGGTRNYYGAYHMLAESFYTINATEGREFKPAGEVCIVLLSYFQNRNCTPTVYVREEWLAEFFGETVPEGLSALVAADWLDDAAMHEKPRRAKRMRAVATQLREFVS